MILSLREKSFETISGSDYVDYYDDLILYNSIASFKHKSCIVQTIINGYLAINAKSSIFKFQIKLDKIVTSVI